MIWWPWATCITQTIKDLFRPIQHSIPDWLLILMVWLYTFKLQIQKRQQTMSFLPAHPISLTSWQEKPAFFRAASTWSEIKRPGTPSGPPSPSLWAAFPAPPLLFCRGPAGTWQCTITFRRTRDANRNSMQNQELSVHMVPIWSNTSEICCIRHEIWED